MNKYELASKSKFDSIAFNYEQSPEGRFTLRYRQKILELCHRHQITRVLDVGCGSGHLLGQIKKSNTCEAYGIDISPNMIEACKRNYDDIYFSVSSGEQLNYEDEFFDLVIICCTLHHLANPHVFYNEAYRVIKPSGLLIVAEPKYPFPIKQLFDFLVLPFMGSGDNRTFSRRRLKHLFESSGFMLLPESYYGEYMTVMKGQKQYV
ncbi:MAG: class I SAM-dependent methyltransferase [Oscillospiraceae bacterium]|nr:class I SAM-dependent methyltransferase [Oscillospiraceae bacterium]